MYSQFYTNLYAESFLFLLKFSESFLQISYFSVLNFNLFFKPGDLSLQLLKIKSLKKPK